MRSAIDELSSLILERYPGTTFSVERDPEEDAVLVWATVDVDDTDEVLDSFLGRLHELREPEWLPLHIIPIRTPERRERALAEQRVKRGRGGVRG
jgi:hypothetical protein